MTGATVLGIDGGGSKTLIAVADQGGSIVTMARGEGINPLDRADWRDVLDRQLRPFIETQGLAGVVGALPAHGEVEAISAAQWQAVSSLFPKLPTEVLNDVDAAHIGAFAGGPGILVLSGTGSMAWARDGAGRSYRVGGWGDRIGDEGSSHWIGLRILGLVSQSLDGRAEPTRLVDAVFDQLGLDRADPMNGLEGWSAHLTNPRAEIAALAPLASRVAETGDLGAIGIIEAAAEELARHVTTIGRQGSLPPIWSFAGGTFASRPLRDAVAAKLGHPPVAPLLPPIGGALLRAAKTLGWSIDPAWINRLAASLAAYPALSRQNYAKPDQTSPDHQPRTIN